MHRTTEGDVDSQGHGLFLAQGHGIQTPAQKMTQKQSGKDQDRAQAASFLATLVKLPMVQKTIAGSWPSGSALHLM